MTLEINPPISIAKAYSPSHITGFYSEVKGESILKQGSLGTGISISKGVRTTVELYDSETNNFIIQINGAVSRDALVSRYIINEFLNKVNKKYFLKVNHEVDVPIGYGIGTSGSGALSLSYALNEALSSGLSDIESAQIAHKAEIECKTGLGTVLSEFYGGLCLRTKAGAPGIGKTSVIKINNYKIAIFCFSPIFTRYFIDRIRKISNHDCNKMIMKVLKTKKISDFLELSHQFSKSLEYANTSCSSLIDMLVQNGFSGSTALFGQTGFHNSERKRTKHNWQDFKKFPCKIIYF
jgi:pantoate kinase